MLFCVVRCVLLIDARYRFQSRYVAVCSCVTWLTLIISFVHWWDLSVLSCSSEWIGVCFKFICLSLQFQPELWAYSKLLGWQPPMHIQCGAFTPARRSKHQHLHWGYLWDRDTVVVANAVQPLCKQQRVLHLDYHQH